MYSVMLVAALTAGGETPGCWGYGGWYGGGYGGWSAGYSCYGPGGLSSVYGCWGGTGFRGYGYGYPFPNYGYGGYGGYPYRRVMSYGPSTVVYTIPIPPETPPKRAAAKPQPATFVVHLPADAKLKVEGTLTRATSSRRVFISPPLEPGQTYTYSLQAQLTRNGQTITVNRDVPVRAGQQSEVTIDMPSATASAKR